MLARDSLPVYSVSVPFTKGAVIRDDDDVPEGGTDLVTLIVGVVSVLLFLLLLDRDGEPLSTYALAGLEMNL